MRIKVALFSFIVNSISIRMLSSCLKQKGYEVICYFCPLNPGQEIIRELIAELKQDEVGLVGISLVTDDFMKAVAITESIKKNHDIPVIWGGAHVNVMPEESLRYADMICMGEGEDALVELVESIEKTGNADTSIKNIWFKTGSEIIRNEIRKLEEDLDIYPFPDYDMGNQYLVSNKGVIKCTADDLPTEYSIITSRGCPYRCTYCYNSYRWDQFSGKGKYLRYRSIPNVISELEYAIGKNKNIREINFWDDSFLSRRIEDFKEFREKYRERIGLPFFALVEPMAYNEEKIKLLKECGLARLQVGIQSGSERVNREVYKRSVLNDKVLKVTESINKLNISAVYDIIYNNPYETVDDLRETLRFLLKMRRPFKMQGYNIIFYPGSEITSWALRDGYISEKHGQVSISSIQGENDSPIKMRGSKVTDRFYDINYETKEKTYYSNVISLFSYNKVPTKVIRYFSTSQTIQKEALLKLFVLAYRFLSYVNNRILGVLK